LTSRASDATPVGFIGLDDHGALIAQAIGRSHFRLHVWAGDSDGIRLLDGIPHTVHADPVQLMAAVHLLSVYLHDDLEVWDLLATPGLSRVMRPGQIIANHGTGDPDENRSIAAHLRDMGVDFLDAPVSGGARGIRHRTLVTTVGGDRRAFDRCAPIFATFSGTVAYLGPSGCGQAARSAPLFEPDDMYPHVERVCGGDWRDHAVCRDADPELFFPDGAPGSRPRQVDRAKEVCAGCPARADCLSWALERGFDYGIWGGTTADERRAIRNTVRRPRSA
jgi:6-phosphogluconate dehydrogenase-like protein/transcription factor WhiB